MSKEQADATVRLAVQADLDAVGRLYDEINDYLDAHVNYPGWKKGVYPVHADAQEGIDAGGLYVAERAGRIVGTVICLHRQADAYRNVPWTVAYESPVITLHTVAVHPCAFGSGVGDAMMAHVERLARADRMRAIRLDVYEKNLPAMRLYERCGFHWCGKVDMGIGETTGLKWFFAYEKVL